MIRAKALLLINTLLFKGLSFLNLRIVSNFVFFLIKVIFLELSKPDLSITRILVDIVAVEQHLGSLHSVKMQFLVIINA